VNRNSGLDRRQFLAAMSATVVASAMPGITKAAAAPARRLAGVFPIAFTPTDAQDKINFDALAAQVTFCRKGGVHGLAWPQLASGWSTLTEQDRMHGAEVLVDAAKGGSTAIVIGVQSKTDVKEAERYAKQAEKLGADAIICIPPEGVKHPTELLSYYQRVGNSTSLPFFAQAVGDFSVDLLVDMFNKIPTFRYVKDEAGDPLERIAEIRKRTNDQLKAFSGRGVATMITEMERGFAGHCPYVSIADLYAAAYYAFHAGDQRRAFDLFGKIQAASSMFTQSDVDVLIARGVFPAGTKARVQPPTPGAPASPPKRAKASIAEIKHVLDTYLKSDLRA
jgi:dihydrodipicolinate synthase/N-acetylneuraminate lyase